MLVAANIASIYKCLNVDISIFEQEGKQHKQSSIIRPLIEAINFSKNQLLASIAVKGLFNLIEYFNLKHKNPNRKIIYNLIRTVLTTPYGYIVKEEKKPVYKEKLLISKVEDFWGIN